MSRTKISLLFLYFLYVQINIYSSDTEIKLFQNEMILSSNESHVIPFMIIGKAVADESFKTSAEGVDILQEAKVLKGYDIGFLRIKTKQVGKANIKIDKLTIKITVRDSKETTELMQGKPEIQTPSEGSFCYGAITVGAMVLNDPYLNPLSDQSVVLQDQLGNSYPNTGRDSISDTFCFYRFVVNCEKLPAGLLQLTVKSTNQNGQTSLSKPITVVILEEKNAKKQMRE